ncbi:MAG: hypothetical protein JST59_02730 [Actinobacteria bacterium]|nr:hypothetical protein [Actinomycetota bacterium]
MSKEESLTNRRTSVGSAMKSSMMAKESIIAKGKNELEERLRQTMEQLKHISELLYDESEPVKSKQITTNITKINEIIDNKTQVTSVAELNPRG